MARLRRLFPTRRKRAHTARQGDGSPRNKLAPQNPLSIRQRSDLQPVKPGSNRSKRAMRLQLDPVEDDVLHRWPGNFRFLGGYDLPQRSDIFQLSEILTLSLAKLCATVRQKCDACHIYRILTDQRHVFAGDWRPVDGFQGCLGTALMRWSTHAGGRLRAKTPPDGSSGLRSNEPFLPIAEAFLFTPGSRGISGRKFPIEADIHSGPSWGPFLAFPTAGFRSSFTQRVVTERSDRHAPHTLLTKGCRSVEAARRVPYADDRTTKSERRVPFADRRTAKTEGRVPCTDDRTTKAMWSKVYIVRRMTKTELWGGFSDLRSDKSLWVDGLRRRQGGDGSVGRWPSTACVRRRPFG